MVEAHIQKEEDWQWVLAQGESSSEKKISTYFQNNSSNDSLGNFDNLLPEGNFTSRIN